MFLNRGLGLLVAGSLFAPGTADAAGEHVFLPKLAPVPPFASTQAAARANGIPLSGFDRFAIQPLSPGDGFTGLITFHEQNGKRTQWLLSLKVEKSGADIPEKRPMVLHTSLGNKLEFKRSSVNVGLRTLGPFVDAAQSRKAPKIKDRQAHFSLDAGNLGLGLDSAASALMRTRDDDARQVFGVKATPFSEAEIAKGRETAKKLGISAEEERAVAGAIPALLSYMGVVRHVKTLEEILFEVLDKPSLWSLVRERGIKANLTFSPARISTSAPENWAMPKEQPAFHLPMGLEINNKPALNVVLAVTKPESPLLSCGGVVGMLAEKPSDDQTYVTLRIISAFRAENRSRQESPQTAEGNTYRRLGS